MTKNTNDVINGKKNNIQDGTERKIILIMGMGINGIDARGWFSAEGMIGDVWNLLETVDTFILGRVIFQEWERTWPTRAKYISENSTGNPTLDEFQINFSKLLDKIPKIVFSKTVKSVDWQNSRVVNTDISTEISRTKKLPGKNIAVVGGVGIVHSLTDLNLIDDYYLYIHPVIFGSGESILGTPKNKVQLKLVESKDYGPDGIMLHFCPVK